MQAHIKLTDVHTLSPTFGRLERVGLVVAFCGESVLTYKTQLKLLKSNWSHTITNYFGVF